MFIRYYVELAHPMPNLEKALLQAPSSWLPGLAESADERGQRLLAAVGFPVDGPRIVKKVSIRIGDPVRSSAPGYRFRGRPPVQAGSSLYSMVTWKSRG